jgi:hypothetical protein
MPAYWSQTTRKTFGARLSSLTRCDLASLNAAALSSLVEDDTARSSFSTTLCPAITLLSRLASTGSHNLLKHFARAFQQSAHGLALLDCLSGKESMREMKVPRDTHHLLWAVGDLDRLSAAARPLLEGLQNKPLSSPARLWEIASKTGLDRPDFRVDPPILRRGLIDNGSSPP